MDRRLALLALALAVAALTLAALTVAGSPAEAAAGDFRLPYGGGQRLLTLQGQNQGSHAGPYNRFAYDFAMGQRDETPFVVAAARAGTVLKVVQGNDPGPDCDPARTPLANYILLDHGDRIGSTYSHLRKGSALVRQGDRVAQGQPLALSGRTGYVCGVAHLHFTVVQLPNLVGLDIPFADPALAADGGRPKTNRWYLSSYALPGAPGLMAPQHRVFFPFMARRAPRP